jgi:two-component system sensor histidine kinase KdpD
MIRWRSLAGYAWAAVAVAACTLAGLAMRGRFDVVNIAMVYVLAVVVVALRHPHGPAIATSIASVVVFDVLFVPPYGTLTVQDAQYVLTFAIMVTVALVVSRLVARIRREAAAKAGLALEAETERIRSTLLASISHDLRTPLAVMAGASSSLAESGDRLPPDERRALAASVFRQARAMADYVAKILQMTRLDAGAIAPSRDWSSLAEIANATLDRLAERLARHRVVVELAPDLPLVRVDAALIDQALGNLVENAAGHTPPDTVIRVRARRVGDEAVVTVEDYGDGLSERDAERVFAKFERGTGAAGGPGLGLAICRSIVRLHGGRAWAERLPEGGTAFHFSVPLESPPTVPAETADA